MEMKETLEPFNHNDPLDHVTLGNMTTHFTLHNIAKTFVLCPTVIVSNLQRIFFKDYPIMQMHKTLEPFNHTKHTPVVQLTEEYDKDRLHTHQPTLACKAQRTGIRRTVRYR